MDRFPWFRLVGDVGVMWVAPGGEEPLDHPRGVPFLRHFEVLGDFGVPEAASVSREFERVGGREEP